MELPRLMRVFNIVLRGTARTLLKHKVRIFDYLIKTLVIRRVSVTLDCHQRLDTIGALYVFIQTLNAFYSIAKSALGFGNISRLV